LGLYVTLASQMIVDFDFENCISTQLKQNVVLYQTINQNLIYFRR